MKKLIQASAAVLIVSLVLLIITFRLNASEGYTGNNTLTIFNWGDYVDPDLIKKFEKETGVKVIYETFDSNEAMLTKIAQGGTAYDIAIPSEYTIEKMKQEDLLLPIDHSKIPNFKNIDPRFLDLPFDPNNEFSVPYFWGTVGILYNPKLIGEHEFKSWNDLWNPEFKNQILLLDSAREVMGFALNSLGYSLNDTNPDHLMEAKKKLDLLTPNVKAIVGDENRMLLANEEAAIGLVWSGTFQEILWENEDVEYVIPEEGSNLWFDNMVIPKTTKNIEAAYKFINFILEPENGAQNADYVGYSTPNMAALEFSEDQEKINDKRFYPDKEVTDKLEVYRDLGKRMVSHYNDLFLEFKMHSK